MAQEMTAGGRARRQRPARDGGGDAPDIPAAPEAALAVPVLAAALNADDVRPGAGIAGPLVTGWAMQRLGPFSFWLVLGATFVAIALHALYRMTRRPTVPVDQTESYLGVLPTASPVAVEAAGAWAAEHGQAERGADASP